MQRILNQLFRRTTGSGGLCRRRNIRLLGLLGGLFGLCGLAVADFDARREVIRLMREVGMASWLEAPVTVSQTADGLLAIADTGLFAIQHELLAAQIGTEPNVVIDPGLTLRPTADSLCVVTHGWMDKGAGQWPEIMAAAIAARVDPNDWLCAAYDWKGGSVVITSVQAAEYARDVAGPRLAAAILALGTDLRHIHLIGHSAGSWTIHTAAQHLAAARPDAVFHLTFLDAYVPDKWDPDGLGRIYADAKRQKRQCWAEHYFTRDITWKLTQHALDTAHNVDITDIDPLVKEHEFPYRWYQATITGAYTRWDEKNEPVITAAKRRVYGFARSRESGETNWQQSIRLKTGNRPLRLTAD